MPIHNIIKEVSGYIEKKIPLTTKRTILVGLSGGADSVALLDILITLGYSCIACHCNFHLRGEESDRDHAFAQNTARRYSVPFIDIHFDTIAFAMTHKISVEMACRQLRYEWFEQMRDKTKSSYVAVAHHRDDSVETILLNLIRGTGIAGLTGISPLNDHIIRPLLTLSRQQIEDYLQSKKIDFVVDSTNLEDNYVRNKIRLNVLPQLQEINPSVMKSITTTADYLSEVETVYLHAIETQKIDVVTKKNDTYYISIEKLMLLPSVTAFLFEVLHPYGFTATQIGDIIDSTFALSGKQFLTHSHILVKDRQEFILSPINKKIEALPIYIKKECLQIDYPIQLQLEWHNAEGFVIPRDRHVACFDADKLKFPLTLRQWEQGDMFHPFGMKGRKKVSDYFNDCKFSLLDKQNSLLLCSGDDILWIVNERTSQKYSINVDTLCILVVYYKI